MRKPLPKSFRTQLVAVIIICTLVPALVVSGILLLQIQQNAVENAITKLELQLRSDADILENKILLLSSVLEQLALDQNNILAAENSVFSVYARNQMFGVTESHPEIKIVQIYDSKLWPTESVPLVYEFMSLDFLFINHAILSDDGKQANLVAFRDDALSLLINEHSGAQVSTDDFIGISVSLYKDNEADPQSDIRTGYLLALINLRDLMGLLDANSSYLISTTPIDSVTIRQKQSTIVQTTTISVGNESVYLGIEYAREQVVTPINRAFQTIALLILGILITAIYIGLFFARRFTRPLENISDLITSYSDGKFTSKTVDLNFEEFVHLYGVLTDMATIIEKNQTELENRVEQRTTELATSNAELQKSLDTQKEMQDHLVEQEKMAQLGGLVAGISHEVNTPIGIGLTAASSMRVFIKEMHGLAEDGTLTRSKLDDLMGKCVECADMVVSNLSRSAELVSNFKDVAVSQSSIEITEFSLAAFLEEVVNSLVPQTKKYDLDITLDVDEDIVLRSYRGAFAQIFTNFIINSLKHGFDPKQHHSVQITAKLDGNALCLTYQDDGDGMSEDVLSHIFEPFYTTKRGRGGTGLGMHIVYNIVTQKLDGRITAESKAGKGTKFIICLPRLHIVKK